MKKIIAIVDEDTRNKVFEILKGIWKTESFIIEGDYIFIIALNSREIPDFMVGFASGIYYQITH